MFGYQGGNSSFQNVSVTRQFKVETDHRALVWMDILKDTNAWLTRWSLLLQSYDFLVEHRKGLKNGNVDGLSRRPWCQKEAANDFAAEEGGRNVSIREPDPPDKGDIISRLGPQKPYGHIVAQ